MNTQTALALAAAVQVLILVAVYATTWPSAPPPTRPLTPIPATEATSIRVWDNPSDTEPDVHLAKGEQGWELAASALAVDPARIEEIVGPLLEQPVRAPVSTTATAWSALGVGEDNWVRKVQIDAGDKTATLVLGGGRDAHIRVVGDDAVYALDELKPWSIRTSPWAWLPEPFHTLDPAQVVRLDITGPAGAWSVARPDPAGAWALSPADPASALDPAKVDASLNALGTLSASGLPPDPRSPEPGTRVAWTMVDGSTGALVLGDEQEGQRRVFSEARGYAVLASAPGLAAFAGPPGSAWAPTPAEPDLPPP